MGDYPPCIHTHMHRKKNCVKEIKQVTVNGISTRRMSLVKLAAKESSTVTKGQVYKCFCWYLVFHMFGIIFELWSQNIEEK